MLDKVSTVSLFVADQDRALAFYTEKMGMVKRMDARFGDNYRWVTVSPEGAETEIVLYLADENWEHYAGVVGKSQALTLEASELDATIATLKDKGVTIVTEPTEAEWGRFAMIEDSEGNTLIVAEA